MVDNAAIGFRAHMGWVAAVAMTLESGKPKLVHSSIVETCLPNDRLSKEPYHVATGWDELARVPPHPNPERAIADGRKIQERVTAEGIAKIAAELKARKIKLSAGIVLAARGWPSYDLDYALGGHAHVHVAEGWAVREAIRSGLKANKIKSRDVDEKSLITVASKALKLTEARLKETLNGLKVEAVALAGGAKASWTQDQKLAALAAWVSLESRA